MKTLNKLLTISLLALALVLVSQFLGAITVDAQFVCSSNADCGMNKFVEEQFCRSNNLYQNYVTYTCNSPGTVNSSCTSIKSPQIVQVCTQKCEANLWYIGCSATISGNTTPRPNPPYNYHDYKQCFKNSIYWFDTYGNRQDIYQTCPLGQRCSGNSCTNGGGSNTGNYIFHSSKGCVNNASYWYDSLGAKQDVYKNCNATSQTCQNGECVGIVPLPQPPSQIPVPVSPIKHFSIKCNNNNIYWYNSNGVLNDIYENCSDNNSCTIDSCTDSKCQNELKCDSSTCSEVSEDYAKYCAKTNSNLTAAVSENSISRFLKSWYGWVIIILILIFLFFVIFRRLSSNNN